MTATPGLPLHDNLPGLPGIDPHTQYLLASGARALAGDWSLGGNDLTEAAEIRGTGDIIVRPNSDLDDGFRFRTTTDEQYLAPVDTSRRLIFGTDVELGAAFAADGLDSNRANLRLLPLGNAGNPYTSAPEVPGLIQWDSVIETDFVNNNFGGVLNAVGVYRHLQAGFGFNHGLIFNHAITYEGAANFGPVFYQVDQPLIRSTGGARTMGQYNSMRSQPRFGPHTGGGTLSVTQVNQIETAAGTIAVGTSVGTWRHLKAGNIATFAGSLTDHVGLELLNMTQGTNIFGIRSFMNSGWFLDQQGTTPSRFAGDVHMNDGVSLALGSLGGSLVELLRPSAGVLRMIGAGGAFDEGLDWDFQNSNNVAVTSPTSAGLNFDLSEIAFGPSTVADGGNNWVFAFSPGLRGTNLAGDYSEVLFSSSSAITVAHAISNFATWTVNAPTISLGGGSILNAANVLIQTNMSQGTNRYGLLITSNPTGGTLNYAFRQSNASAKSRFDGILDINRPIATGGGAAAALGQIGGSGPAVAAQNEWVQIEVNGNTRFIPVWA